MLAALVESEEEKSQSTANFPSFEGCYALDIKFDELAHSWDEENSNLRCAQRCRRDGYIISATKGKFLFLLLVLILLSCFIQKIFVVVLILCRVRCTPAQLT